MSQSDDDWRPGPELLAAYFDGELAGRPDGDALRERIQDWLRCHAEARGELEDYRQLDRLWKKTVPPEPSADAWEHVAERLRRAWLSRLARPRRAALGGWVAALVATAACVALLVWLGVGDESAPKLVQPKLILPAPVDDMEVFPVATAAEIAILHVEGADTQTLAVGELPVQGALELAGPGEVALTSVQPDARDNMIPNVRIGGTHRPMIWAPFAAEDR
jgi:hypothetical protein